eukprot:s2053_g15.t1
MADLGGVALRRQQEEGCGRLAPSCDLRRGETPETEEPRDELKRCLDRESPRSERDKTFGADSRVETDLKLGSPLELGWHGAQQPWMGHASSAAGMIAGCPGGDREAQHDELPAKASGDDFHRTDEAFCEPLNFAGMRFSDLGGPLGDALQQYMWVRHSKILTMASDGIFPLPLGDYPGVDPKCAPWMRAVLQALNSLNGAAGTSTLRPTEVQKGLVQSIGKFVETMMGWSEQVPPSNFADLFEVRGVDYRGEEIKLAKSFDWKSIAGALPKEVGTLDLASFCTGGCRHYVDCFEDYLVPPEMQVIGRTPKIHVAEEDWFGVCEGLINAGICRVLPRRLLHHVGEEPLLNGLFAVSKNEYDETGVELHRLIMNLIPVNKLCRSLKGDVGTLPTISGLSAFYLEDQEVAMMSSEDIRCFYYLFKIPESWHRYMGFARLVPPSLVPSIWEGEPCHLTALVLPMGFINAVGLAQHIHRNVVRWALRSGDLGDGDQELRRDRPAPHCKEMYRVYLDNWDQIKKVDTHLAAEVEGRPTAQQLALRQTYLDLELPRHPKKAVEMASVAEVQGALLDGRAGVAYAKPEKVMKYLGLGWELVKRGKASLRELQVVAGGFVYITMFRRQLLCSLNEVWVQIEALKAFPPVVKLVLPREVKLELIRFLCLLPLAQMDFRLPMHTQVTASDASSTGGGISISVGLTDYGVSAQQALVRGELHEPVEMSEVLTVGLFDGIGALRVAVDLLHLPMAGHISVECNPYARRVLESAFPGSHHVESVEAVTEDEVGRWACEYSSVGVVLVGAGPPCQDVSKLNVDRKGSQKGLRSSLYKEIPRIVDLIKRKFPWAQVHQFVESVASMDKEDRAAMSRDLQMTPKRVDSAGISLARRPRLYWFSWEVLAETGLELCQPEGSGWYEIQEIVLQAEVNQRLFLEAGWFLPPGNRLATFTTSRPSPKPGRRPAGLHTCDAATLTRWREDDHRYPPYQYKPEYGVHHLTQGCRVPSILEREVILGFPAHYTAQCVVKSERQASWVADVRKTLLGNTWSVPVVACLLKQLFERLGISQGVSVQGLVQRATPGGGERLQTVLQRPPVARESPALHPEDGLARRLSGLVSIKGEDLLLQATSEQAELQPALETNNYADQFSPVGCKHPAGMDVCPYFIQSGRPPESACPPTEMGKGKKHLEGKSQRERKKIRKQMGSLKSLTLQPRTRQRYDKAKEKFYHFLQKNNVDLPWEKHQLDGLLCDYLEWLWANGEGRALASDTLASLQDTSPRIRGCIPGAWRLLKTWHVNEIPCRAPPLPERVLTSLAGFFIFHQRPDMALSVLLGFYTMLRTGELLGIKNRDVTIDEGHRSAVISLGYTKGGKRTGAAESVTVTVSEVIRRLAQWKRSTPAGSNLTPAPHTWRKEFARALEALGLQSWEFRPYSLRRGGATFWFAQHGSLDRILLQGRWMAAKTARTYLNEGLAVLTEMKIPVPSVIVEPGDVIYVPQDWWRSIWNLEDFNLALGWEGPDDGSERNWSDAMHAVADGDLNALKKLWSPEAPSQEMLYLAARGGNEDVLPYLLQQLPADGVRRRFGAISAGAAISAHRSLGVTGCPEALR